ncbi:MAG: LuxR family transcriptional regulator [Firmicutes bacterium]|nr:LuxR family transcriptional regulator [Bacillota bacterium]
MYISVVFIGYICALFIAMTGIALIGLTIMKSRTETTDAFKSVRNFSFAILAFCLWHFFYYCRENLLAIYEIGTLGRVLDYALVGVIMPAWLFALSHFGSRMAWLRKTVLGLALAGVSAGIVMACAYTDPYYYIKNEAARMFNMIFFAAVGSMTLVVCGVAAVKLLRQGISVLRRNYLLVTSMALALWSVNQTIVNIQLSLGKFGISAWQVERFEPAGPLMSIISFATLLFIFKEDFSPIYFPNEHQNVENQVKVVAQEFGLTEREFEILALLYEGDTNQSIADQLVISINTVKRHIQNIYKKLSVSSRVELVHVINSQNHLNR